MKRNFFFVITIMCLLNASAQNIDRDDVKLNFILLPTAKLPDTTETYYVSFKQASTQYSNAFLTPDEADKISLNGYYRLASSVDADIIIEAELVNELIYKGVKLVENEYTYKKDKNSPEIKYTAYTYSIGFAEPKFHYKIKTGNGKTLEDGFLGGKDGNGSFGNADYFDHYRSEYEVRYAWSEAKTYKLAEWEKFYFKQYFPTMQGICSAYCLLPWNLDYLKVRYVKEKKTDEYDDLRNARDLLLEGVEYIATDKVSLINKLIQPDYNKRVETIGKAIAIWEKALVESDLKNKKARIDKKVTRHIYYNLSLAYLLVDNFEKAQQYLQGRDDDESGKGVLKNLFAGMNNLSSFIDSQKKRYEANKWRPMLTADSTTYVYKDPATRQREMQEAELARQKARADSIGASKKIFAKPKKPAPKKPVAGANVAKKH